VITILQLPKGLVEALLHDVKLHRYAESESCFECCKVRACIGTNVIGVCNGRQHYQCIRCTIDTVCRCLYPVVHELKETIA
jgi:hypothetical protein